MRTKTCSQCRQTKPMAEFYRDEKAATGYTSWCRQCYKEDAATPEQISKRCAYGKTASGRQVNNIACAKYRESHPKQFYAHDQVRLAILRGDLPRPDSLSCPCGERAIVYHHSDYDSPLAVEPLCHQCHRGLHSS